MNIQKAMRIRSELKAAAAKLNLMLDSVDYNLTFENQPADEAALAEKRGRKLFAITDACLSLNTALEAVNRKGHELLFRETAVKSKLLYVERLLEKEREIKAVSTESRVDYENTDAKGNFRRTDVTVYGYPMLDDSVLGMGLVQMKKQLNKELEKIRDEISAFNATQQVNWEMPEDLL